MEDHSLDLFKDIKEQCDKLAEENRQLKAYIEQLEKDKAILMSDKERLKNQLQRYKQAFGAL